MSRIFYDLDDSLWKRPELTNITEAHVIRVNRQHDNLAGGAILTSNWRGDPAKLPPAGKRMLGGHTDPESINRMAAKGIALSAWDNWQAKLGREKPRIPNRYTTPKTFPNIDAIMPRAEWLMAGGIERKSIDVSICEWNPKAGTVTAIGHFIDTGLARDYPGWIPLRNKTKAWKRFENFATDWSKITLFARQCSERFALRKRILANLSWHNRSPLIWDANLGKIRTMPEIEFYRILGGWAPHRERALKIQSALPKGQSLMSLLPDKELGEVIRAFPEEVL